MSSGDIIVLAVLTVAVLLAIRSVRKARRYAFADLCGSSGCQVRGGSRMSSGDIIVLAVLTVAVLLAIRSVRKARRSGGHCNGDCGSCGGCHGK